MVALLIFSGFQVHRTSSRAHSLTLATWGRQPAEKDLFWVLLDKRSESWKVGTSSKLTEKLRCLSQNQDQDHGSVGEDARSFIFPPAVNCPVFFLLISVQLLTCLCFLFFSFVFLAQNFL
ncbi:hypothetical protein XENOCAPTIV_026104 [Xenoophorus captivus]|uniref:Uncharacterized protein n=1 Tax=Xenoophorus captivus TaxID=1517983 RepID=A0ABV0QL41_9TELE